MYQILIVEDDKNLNNGITLALQDETTAFTKAYCLEEARRCWEEKSFDMILLDVNLPDGSGYDFLTEIRSATKIPVLMITANDLEIDEITGLTLGADDYITKPFSLMVLRARVARMRKRTTWTTQTSCYQDQRYQFDFDTMQFIVDGREVLLSKTEQKLLKLFTKNPAQILSRERLMEVIWPAGSQYVDENALSVTVGRLRHKLEGNKKTCPIQTIYGLGYVWERQV